MFVFTPRLSWPQDTRPSDLHCSGGFAFGREAAFILWDPLLLSLSLAFRAFGFKEKLQRLTGPLFHVWQVRMMRPVAEGKTSPLPWLLQSPGLKRLCTCLWRMGDGK